MNLYLATAPNGRVFWADRPAAVGATLTALATPTPLEQRKFWVSRTPENVSSSRWPRALWRVQTDERVPGRDARVGLTRLTVVEQLDPVLSLGPCGPEVIAFFDRLETLDASGIRLVATVGEEWEQANPDAVDDSIPYVPALDRALKVAQKARRGGAQSTATDHARQLGERVSGEYFYMQRNDRKAARVLYERLKRAVSDATYLAALALAVADKLPAADFALLTEDWSRLTGDTLTAPAVAS